MSDGTKQSGDRTGLDRTGLDRTGLPRDRRVASELLKLDRQRYAVEQHTMLSIAEIRLLWMLSDGQPRSLRELATALHLEQSTVNRQVNAAIDAGYLYRFTEQGRSSGLIAPTPECHRRFTEDTEFTLHMFERALDGLGDQAQAFLEQLETFVTAYTDAAERATAISCPQAEGG